MLCLAFRHALLLHLHHLRIECLLSVLFNVICVALPSCTAAEVAVTRMTMHGGPHVCITCTLKVMAWHVVQLLFCGASTQSGYPTRPFMLHAALPFCSCPSVRAEKMTRNLHAGTSHAPEPLAYVW